MATPQLTQLAIVGACGAHQRPVTLLATGVLV